VTQLPTPVMPCGAFPAVLPVKIDVAKRSTTPVAAGRARIVSAFDPEPLLVPVLPTTQPPTRHISNPGAPVAGVPRAVPLPAQEPEQPPLQGRVLHAPASGRTYVCEDVVGTGAFSTVARARDAADPALEVAVKIVLFPRDGSTSVSSFRAFIVRELGLLAHLHHPCIVTLLDYSVTPLITPLQIRASYDNGGSPPVAEDLSQTADAQQLFFLGYCRGGNLFSWLLAHYHGLSRTLRFWQLVARVVAEVVVAVVHMHRQRIIHRDIKLENVLLNERFVCTGPAPDPRRLSRPVATITDFGLSKRLALHDQLLSTKCGSQDYVSPELLMGLHYSGKLLDAWALGVLVYSIIENRLPFDMPSPDLLQQAGVSPSAPRRRRSRHSPAHRIAMIDWEWYRAVAIRHDNDMDPEARKIVGDLQALVDTFLVRKEKRPTVEEALETDAFAWIKECVPSHF
ncbi:kinase-like protein, partial [Metschnikowia bicuspidata var. bicuspidata NRRL YB-4993]